MNNEYKDVVLPKRYREGLEIGAKWLQWWLDQHECDNNTTDLIERLKALKIGPAGYCSSPMGDLIPDLITALSPVMPEEVNKHHPYSYCGDRDCPVCGEVAKHIHDIRKNSHIDCVCYDNGTTDLLGRLFRTSNYWKAEHIAGNELIESLTSQRDQLAEALEKGIGALLALSYGHRYAAKKHKKLDAEFKRIMDKT